MDPRTALVLGRVSNLPTVWSNVLAGTLLAGGRMEDGIPVLPLALASLLYLGGMYLNDAFDRDFDAKEVPTRPIPSGRATVRAVFAAGFAMLGGGILLSATAGGAVFPVALALAAGILAYDIHHKGNRLSPLLMGLCRALVYALAGFAAAAAAAPSPLLAAGAVALFCHVAGLTYAARQENRSGFRLAWPLGVLAAAPVLVLAAAGEKTESWPFLILFLAWMGYGLTRLTVRRRCDVRAAVGAMIAAISLLDAVWIAGVAGPLPALAGVAAFALTVAAQRFVPGT